MLENALMVPRIWVAVSGVASQIKECSPLALCAITMIILLTSLFRTRSPATAKKKDVVLNSLWFYGNISRTEHFRSAHLKVVDKQDLLFKFKRIKSHNSKWFETGANINERQVNRNFSFRVAYSCVSIPCRGKIKKYRKINEDKIELIQVYRPQTLWIWTQRRQRVSSRTNICDLAHPQ